jgi:hypothetical protein
MAERQQKRPEQSLARAHQITRLDLECDPQFTELDVGHWVVMGSSGIVRCDGYQQARDMASSFNRCPA